MQISEVNTFAQIVCDSTFRILGAVVSSPLCIAGLTLSLPIYLALWDINMRDKDFLLRLIKNKNNNKCIIGRCLNSLSRRPNNGQGEIVNYICWSCYLNIHFMSRKSKIEWIYNEVFKYDFGTLGHQYSHKSKD